MADAIVPQLPIATRAEAKARRDAAREAGEKFFFSGRPCKKGHFSKKYVSTGDCAACLAERGKELRAQKDPEEQRAYFKAYQQANADRIRARRTEYRERNKEELNAKRLAIYHANKEADKPRRKAYAERAKEHIAAYQKAYREENADRLKEYSKQQYAKNPAPYIEKAREWSKANPLAKRIYTNRRRARLRSAEGKHTAAELKALMVKQRGKCACCREPLKHGYDVDHIVPLAKGGTNDILNIQLLCPPCNRSKGAKDPLEWAQANGRLL